MNNITGQLHKGTLKYTVLANQNLVINEMVLS